MGSSSTSPSGGLIESFAVRLFDAHNHFQDDWLKPHWSECLLNLEQVGLVKAVVNGTTQSDWMEVSTLARQHSWVIPSYGLHPWYLTKCTNNWEAELSLLLEQGGFLGEIGLDRWKEPYDFEEQKQIFRKQLDLGRQWRRPVTIHCLQAWGGLIEFVRAGELPSSGFLLHAYGGPVELVAELVRGGAYFSFNGYFLNERKVEHREVFRLIPLDRLLVETDAPAMPLPKDKERFPLPSSPEGKQVNHPANLLAVYEGLAEIRQIPLGELVAIVEANFQELFGS